LTADIAAPAGDPDGFASGGGQGERPPAGTTRPPRPSRAESRGASWRSRIVRQALVVSVSAMRSRSGGGPPDPDGPVSDLEDYALGMRTGMEKLAARFPGKRGVSVRDEMHAPVAGLWVVDDRARVRTDLDASAPGGGDDVVRGDEVATTARVVLHLHGGGYCMGSPATHRGLGATLSRTARAAVFLPEYRLAPEHVFPAALDDAYATYRWLVDDRGVAPERLAVTGDSAGGGLAASLLVRLRDEGLPLPACYVGMSPWTDLAGTGASMTELDGTDPWLSARMVAPAARSYAGATALDDPAVSPLYADLTGLPPVLVHVGGDEILLDDAVRFVEACREQGVDASLGRFEGLWHVFHAFPGMPESRDALREIGAFVRRHTSGDLAPDSRGAPGPTT
jgi:epsilon-lactone hydrolase